MLQANYNYLKSKQLQITHEPIPSYEPNPLGLKSSGEQSQDMDYLRTSSLILSDSALLLSHVEALECHVTFVKVFPLGKHQAMSTDFQVQVMSEEGVENRSISKKPRIGARGEHKVKTGCQTCKIRHKKCNEAKPACFQCTSTGRRCDFSVSHSHIVPRWRVRTAVQHLPSGLPDHMLGMTSFEVSHFEYFRRVCARDLALYFESPSWESLVLRYAHMEPSIYHAALSISSMSKNDYYPTTTMPSSYDPGGQNTTSPSEYCLAQYSLAIQRLNARLDRSIESVELAAFASILFIYIEGMQGYKTSMHIHLRGGLALARCLQHLSPNVGYLEFALWQIQEQVEQIEAIKK
ncbi:uncharacterized protein Z519_09971 [Cladophialophora bantiana CBS 173.52]|uniref:Zn(2)-C6 fungal-type domain-containing protein n=1 Tax=Cladophialophora bantiana (strain ATCC 10958 / CBS 173.52 / CDC B-1940 / NIH 8579) TaxID=1442370 RepID=A0A0D2HX22_CLAB1|nr:uncharacterized protein Z519_09971 [Cladophialophora bantiana CBS 173.52]KIW89119.1 hypothetical protein Z519_09971 [Cladophialophora bantiana CBS 173.52]